MGSSGSLGRKLRWGLPRAFLSSERGHKNNHEIEEEEDLEAKAESAVGVVDGEVALDEGLVGGDEVHGEVD